MRDRRLLPMTVPGTMAIALLAGAIVFPHSSAQADAASAFSTMAGSWSGSGQMRLEGGRTENLRCRANYTDRKGGLGISLRCASSSSKVNLRANLTGSGSKVSGSWEEREFNTGGSASGSANGNNVSLSISGGLDGSMQVTTNGGRQQVSITTQNVALKGISIGLSRE
jgi:hypothetical protein